MWLTRKENNSIFREGTSKYFIVKNIKTGEEIIDYNQRKISEQINMDFRKFNAILKNRRISEEYQIKYIDKEMVENGI